MIMVLFKKKHLINEKDPAGPDDDAKTPALYILSWLTQNEIL